MKRIIILSLMLVLLSVSVLSWSATRTITGTQVTLTVDETGGTGVYSIQETLNGLTTVSYPTSKCGMAGSVLTCDYEDGNGPITYTVQLSGAAAGTISGVIAGGYPASTKAITGASQISACIPATCTSLGRVCGSVSDGCTGTLNCGTCAAGQTCNAAGQCVASCTNECNTLGFKGCTALGQPTLCGNFDADACLEWQYGTDCPNGCTSGVCNAAPACTPYTCVYQDYAGGVKDCGIKDDGCGGTVNCNYQAYAGGVECPYGYNCINGQCEAYSNIVCSSTNTLLEGETQVIDVSSNSYEVTTEIISLEEYAGGVHSVNFLINGERLFLLEGETRTIETSGDSLTLSEIVSQPYAGGVNQVSFCFNGVAGNVVAGSGSSSSSSGSSGGGTLNPDRDAFLNQMGQYYDDGESNGWNLSLFSRIANFLRSFFN